MDRRAKATLHREKAKQLMARWAVSVAQARYSNDGHWYATLSRFPAALVDANGYVLFNSEEEYLRSPYLSIGKQISVRKPGISGIPEYVRRMIVPSGRALVDECPTGRTFTDQPSFTHTEVFPIVARLIMQASARRPGEFVMHDSLVSLFLEDADGADIIHRTRATSSFNSDHAAASNMVAWFSQQISIGASEWSDFLERERRADTWAYRPVASATPSGLPVSDYRALEGEPRLFFHMRRERDLKLVKAKREAARSSAGELECEACGFVASGVYEDMAADLCEVHHRRPLADSVNAVTTQLSDLAILCPTCHRAIHQTKPMMTVEAFRSRYHRNYRPLRRTSR